MVLVLMSIPGNLGVHTQVPPLQTSRFSHRLLTHTHTFPTRCKSKSFCSERCVVDALDIEKQVVESVVFVSERGNSGVFKSRLRSEVTLARLANDLESRYIIHREHRCT